MQEKRVVLEHCILRIVDVYLFAFYFICIYYLFKKIIIYIMQTMKN